MIPMIAVIRVRSAGKRGFTLWVPLFLIWLLLAPIILLLLPFFFIFCLFTLINPLRALKIFAEIWASIRGTHIEVTDPCQAVSVKIL